MLKLERRQLKKTKAANCVSWFLVILGLHRRTIFAKNWFCPVQKTPQKWFYVHLGRVMHINHRNYAQLSRNEVILSSTYFIASWKLEWEHFFFFLFVCNMHLIFFKYWFGNNLHMKILLCQICICMINVCLYFVMHLCIRLSRGFTLG